MSTPRGYSSQQKDDRLKNEFVTVEPAKPNQMGMSVLAHAWVYLVGADVVEANSTTSVINATAHAALKGDLIRFTSGTFNNREFVVSDVATNTITLAETLTSAPLVGVTFDIQRRKAPLVGADGSIPVSATVGPVQFVLDGVDTEVLEDTVTPANNRPLPVKLVSFTGDINVTADQLNVALSASGATPDSVRIGDGTDELAINGSGEALVTATQSGSWTVGISGTVPLPTGAATETTLSSINTKTPALGAAVTASSTPVNIASDQIVPVSAASLPLPSGAATSANQTNNLQTTQIVNAAGNPVTVNTLATNPLGTDYGLETNSLMYGLSTSGGGIYVPAKVSPSGSVQVGGSVDVGNISGTVSLPTGAATETTLSSLDGKVANNYGVATGAVRTASQVGNASGIADFGSGALSAQTLRTVIATDQPAISVTSVALDVVDVQDTPLLDASSTNIPGSAASPLQVVASLAATVKKIQVLDTTGFFFGVYTGAAASEVLKFIVGPGSDQTIDASIASGTRISLRSMTTTAISSGNVAINFIG